MCYLICYRHKEINQKRLGRKKQNELQNKEMGTIGCKRLSNSSLIEKYRIIFGADYPVGNDNKKNLCLAVDS